MQLLSPSQRASPPRHHLSGDVRRQTASPTFGVEAEGNTGLDQAIGSAAAPVETLSGLVERVTYHNAENGFCVLRVKARGQRDLVAVVGHAATINAGEFISATGLWTTDREHGLQFKATLAWCTDQPLSPGKLPSYFSRLRSAWGMSS